jgi:hypothetical protein
MKAWWKATKMSSGDMVIKEIQWGEAHYESGSCRLDLKGGHWEI